jgi:hypothetical protein
LGDHQVAEWVTIRGQDEFIRTYETVTANA